MAPAQTTPPNLLQCNFQILVTKVLHSDMNDISEHNTHYTIMQTNDTELISLSQLYM